MTSISGFRDDDVSAQIRAIAPTLEGDDAVRAFARVAWSGLAEPGDRVAGLLVARLGPVAALNAVVSATPASDIAAKVTGVGERVQADTSPETGANIEPAIADALERWRPRLNAADVSAHVTHAIRVGATLVTPELPEWPSRMNDLGIHAPHVLWCRGDVRALAGLDRSVSVVGARASTAYGEHVTMDIVTTLAERRVVIVSGAAYGIDGMAHRAALAAEGTTVAVLAGGIDRLYPSGHDTLLGRIIDTGVVVSELPCGFAPTKWRFLQRNRLIAAVSRATVVVEAGWRSGSLNTAHHALDLDRPVGAVPGPVTSASSAGCHRLLRETPALCVASVDDVMALAGLVPEVSPDDQALRDPGLTRVVDALSTRKPRGADDIARIAGLSSSDVRALLGLAQLTGLASEQSGGWLRT